MKIFLNATQSEEHIKHVLASNEHPTVDHQMEFELVYLGDNFIFVIPVEQPFGHVQEALEGHSIV